MCFRWSQGLFWCVPTSHTPAVSTATYLSRVTARNVWDLKSGKPTVSVIYCCLTSHTFSGLKQQFLLSPVAQESGDILAVAGGLTLGQCFSHLGARLGRGPFQNHAHGCWQDAVPLWLLARGLPPFLAVSVPIRAAHNRATGFHHSQQEGKQEKACKAVSESCIA